MDSKKPQRSPSEIEDIILRKILLISLTDPSPSVAYLEQTAAELLSESKPLLLNRDLIERVLIDRLSLGSESDPSSSSSPLAYLTACYSRCNQELKKISSMKDPSVRSQIEASVRLAKSLIASYSRIHVGNPDMFGSRVSPSSELLKLVFSEVASPMDGESSLAGEARAPQGFLDEFFRNGSYDEVEGAAKEVFERLRESVDRVSALGNFQQPLRALVFLVNYPNCAKALVNHPRWIPKERHLLVGEGRVLEMMSILGAFLHVSALPDYKDFRSKPSVG